MLKEFIFVLNYHPEDHSSTPDLAEGDVLEDQWPRANHTVSASRLSVGPTLFDQLVPALQQKNRVSNSEVVIRS